MASGITRLPARMFRRFSLLRRLAPSTHTMSTSPLSKPLTLALIQLATGPDKPLNLTRASTHVSSAAAAGANLIVLPECFNSPYGTEHFASYAEAIPGPSHDHLSKLAAAHGIHLIAGSIPERDPADGRLYNTCMVFSPRGELVAKHRKLHLFDIDIPGKMTFRESEVLTAGREMTLVDVEGYGKVGVAICYDVRFPELAMVAARKGAFAMVYPGAFNMTTGPVHWELLARARAVDNQVYVGMCSPARDLEGTGYVAWGESMVVGPAGEVVKKAGAGEETVIVRLDPEKLEEMRKGIPVSTQRRFDVYADVSRAGPTE